MSMIKESAGYFEQTAGSWDELRAGYFSAAVRDAAIAKSYLRPEMAVADVGAGIGFMTAALAPLVKRVYAVDGSVAMLAVAKKNLSGFSNVEFHEADAASLPFPEEILETVFANMLLHHTADPLAAVGEMVRVLVPGGRLVITDLDAHAHAWLKDEIADAWQGFDRQKIRAWFEQAGLVNVIVDDTEQSCCAISTGASRKGSPDNEAKISIFVATGTRRMAMRGAVQDSYAAVARSGSSCGCSPSAEPVESECCSPRADTSCCSSQPESNAESIGYSHVELSTAPQEAAEISLGCGNPTALAALKPGEVVLDIGSGGGLDAFLAAARVASTGRVIGVDMTPAMLERSRASAARNSITNVEFRQGYAEELPVEDSSVDVIISNCVINLTEDKGRVFREAFRVLKPGGRLEVSDIVTSQAMPFELRQNAAGWAECVTGALPEQEYLDLIAQAGFNQVTVRRKAGASQVNGISVYSAIVSARKPA
jgi:arsenite methyltransferase